MRRIHVTARQQIAAAFGAGAFALLALFGALQVIGVAPMAAAMVARDQAMLAMHQEVGAMRDEMATIRREAKVHAARLDQRQAFLDAVLTGKAAPALPADVAISRQTAALVAPLGAAEQRQIAMAARAQAAIDQRYAAAADALGRIGIQPSRVAAVGGPYEPVDGTAARGTADPAFRALFDSWKRLETLQRGSVSIPSQQPTDVVTLTSGFGVRSDPFRGGAAMHAGVDIPGPHGAAIYATADGVVGRAGWASGYGNLVELDHGRGIATRYGHLSAILVAPGQRVKRGQLIARMGSTGRSTGTHLHYEVRLDGQAVNPVPFLRTQDYLAAVSLKPPVAMGGPRE